jgi:peptide-methionine (R)-S-oxide reductase
MPDRRTILIGSAAAGAAAVIGGGAWIASRPEASAVDSYSVDLSPEEWAARLTPAEFEILRDEATEPPYSSPLDALFEPGIYACAGCANPAYSSEHKYDSGTGWPSFWQAIAPDRIGTKADYKLVLPRTEVHCARCGGHFGHIFDDGPSPTGKRHCLNGLALDFLPATA